MIVFTSQCERSGHYVCAMRDQTDREELYLHPDGTWRRWIHYYDTAAEADAALLAHPFSEEVADRATLTARQRARLERRN